MVCVKAKRLADGTGTPGRPHKVGWSAAAREADISATMAAKHIQALEARLGSRLLNRTTRRQSLTEVGQIYYDRCKRLLAEVDAVDSSVGQRRAAPRGTLRITSPVTFGTRRLAPAPIPSLSVRKPRQLK